MDNNQNDTEGILLNPIYSRSYSSDIVDDIDGGIVDDIDDGIVDDIDDGIFDDIVDDFDDIDDIVDDTFLRWTLFTVRCSRTEAGGVEDIGSSPEIILTSLHCSALNCIEKVK